jgi:flagellar biosynthesis/type III secretory pathway M-ring protein FliF/YscJ
MIKIKFTLIIFTAFSFILIYLFLRGAEEEEEEEEEEDQNSTIETKIPERSPEQIAAGKLEMEKIKKQIKQNVTRRRCGGS